MRVVLLVPCFVDQLSPDTGLAAVELLERLGCEVSCPDGQTCCGQPFATAGAVREARRLARRQLELLRGADAVVCPSGSCAATVRRRYRDLLELDADARELCERTFELGEFIAGPLGRVSVGAFFPHRVALLPSCHGLRDLGLGTPSESLGPAAAGSTEVLLRAVEGLELVKARRPDECCGFGGLFAVDFPELSARIGRDRLDALGETGADFVTSTDTTCLLHLDGLRRRSGRGPRPLHLAEILVRTA